MVMESLFDILNVGGDVGVWVLVALVWRFDKRMTGIEYGLQGHMDLDAAEFKRVNYRLEAVENNQ